MRISDNLQQETKLALLKIVNKQRMTRNDIQRSQIKSEEYALEIVKIRNMTKYELVKFINNTKANKSVQLGLKIAHSSSPRMYRMLDLDIRNQIEMLNYAKNRLYAS